MQFDVIVMLIFLATLPQTLNVIFSMEIALRHHRFCDQKYSNLECACTSVYISRACQEAAGGTLDTDIDTDRIIEKQKVALPKSQPTLLAFIPY